ncbi:MAG: thioredoxin family protein [Anaerolineae bacterium]|nr:thioredoxin family protein [Anaerolineae bacterium]
MLQTNLTTLQSKEELNNLIAQEEKVAVCCGRMGPMCIPVYGIFEVYEEKYPDIKFRNMDFDTPDADVIKLLPECRGFNGLPFTVYYRNGKVVKATTSIQSAKQIKDIIEEVFA